jgi:DnaJ-class molecular chaperone
MSKRDYYDILGISKSAPDEEIKRAYKRLAKEYHPDVAKDKAQATEKFKEINEAYQILSDPQKRKQYDQFGHVSADPASGAGWNPFAGSQGGQWGPFTYSYSQGGSQGFDFGEGIDPFDIFEQVFGFRGYGGGHKTHKGKNYSYSLQVSFVDALKGCEKEISINGKSLKVKIPAGIHDSAQIKYSGEGEPAPKGGIPGDLFLSIRVQDYPGIERDENSNAYSKVKISFRSATLGDVIDVISIDPKSPQGVSNIKLKIPAGTQHDTSFRIRGQGFPIVNNRGRGDHFVLVKVPIPTHLSREQVKILEQF